MVQNEQQATQYKDLLKCNHAQTHIINIIQSAQSIEDHLHHQHLHVGTHSNLPSLKQLTDCILALQPQLPHYQLSDQLQSLTEINP